MLDSLYQKDRFSADCQTQYSPDFESCFNYGTDTVDYLRQLGPLTFPIKNKSKSQNTHITNFQYEQDKHLKQETFMLCFDLNDR